MLNATVTNIRATRPSVSNRRHQAENYYRGGFAAYEDPADYVRIPTLKGVRLG
ncbi:hypothetical protein [Paenibacillus humicus]|uniref:hypothetical protein n=1 Tax=Paenibacillus humicus TaxID=412861 RepID=UPI0013E2E338|nr:hypothetical protein [Paenibacillus humicus]